MIRDQNFITELAALRENITVYLAFTYRTELRLDRHFNPHLYGSFGLAGEYININKSIDNGNFFLIDLPLYVRYSTIDSILNPQKGFVISYKIIPYFNIRENKGCFLQQILTTNFYVPMEEKMIIFAFRTQIGSIALESLRNIPFNKRFLGGSDDDLRGYRYKTVSPNNTTGDPIGGRSFIYFTFEPRIRITEKIGLVPFTDWGTVSEKIYPNPYEKWFKSIGIGLRYYTFFGPLRADIAFPLNKRRRDPNYRIYVSIGQTF